MCSRFSSASLAAEQSGYVPVSGGATTIPFECLCGGRSMEEFYLDLHRIPDAFAQRFNVIRIRDTDRGRLIARGLVRQQLNIVSRRQTDQLNLIRQIIGDLARARANRSRASQEDNFFHSEIIFSQWALLLS